VRRLGVFACVWSVALAHGLAAPLRDNVAAVKILASVDGGTATAGPIHARKDQKVTLYAAVEVAGHWYTDAPFPHARPLAAAPHLTLHWNRIEPAANDYSNEDATGFHFTAIEYKATSIDATTTSITADVHPTLTPDHGDGVGTMRYQLVVTANDRTLATPGTDARRGRGSGGLTDAVMRVSIRRDDTYLGYLTEMYGQPYIWASAGTSDASHQSEHLEGSDCADFVVYGARRMGKHIRYTWTGGLPAITTLVTAGTRGDDGIYRDDHGRPLPFTRPGDLILFPRHVGVLSVDRGTRGVLDDQDLMMHTLFDSPKEQPIADSGYADKPVELRRLK
jgi:cell wall-associated NlpC family hydrolase